MAIGMRKVVLFTGVLSVVGGALVVVACSSDSTTTSSGGVPTVDANRDTGGNPPNNPPPPPSGDDGGGDGSGPDCTAIPKIRDNSMEYYCAFVPKLADGGSQSYCSNTEVCCNPGKLADGGFADSYCAADSTKPSADLPGACAAGAAAAGSTWIAAGGDTFECADKNNCGAGEICVMVADTTGPISFAALNKNNGKDITGCGAIYAKNIGGTRCCTPGATCPNTGEFHLCGTTDTCVAGSTCTPFSGFFRDLAYCK